MYFFCFFFCTAKHAISQFKKKYTNCKPTKKIHQKVNENTKTKGEWIELPKLRETRAFSSNLIYKNKLIVNGGINYDNKKAPKYYKNTEIFAGLTNQNITQWQWVKPKKSIANMNEPRYHHAMYAFDNHLIVCGGNNDKNKLKYLCEIYNFDTNQWQPIQIKDQVYQINLFQIFLVFFAMFCLCLRVLVLWMLRSILTIIHMIYL